MSIQVAWTTHCLLGQFVQGQGERSLLASVSQHWPPLRRPVLVPSSSWASLVWAGDTVWHVSLAARKPSREVRGTPFGLEVRPNGPCFHEVGYHLNWGRSSVQLGKGPRGPDILTPSTISSFESSLFLCRCILMVITKASAVLCQLLSPRYFEVAVFFLAGFIVHSCIGAPALPWRVQVLACTIFSFGFYCIIFFTDHSSHTCGLFYLEHIIFLFLLNVLE